MWCGEGEVFEHWIDQTGEHFKHVPGISDGVAPVELVYAAALTKDGAFYVAVMTMAEINKDQGRMPTPLGKIARGGKWPDEMMKKTALRRLSKLLPAGRDFFEDEEDEPLPQPTPQLAVNNERPPGAAAALETFAGHRAAPIPNPARWKMHCRSPIERGQIARQTGAPRRAIPGEYREEADKAEPDAWLAGYDAKEEPSDEVP